MTKDKGSIGGEVMVERKQDSPSRKERWLRVADERIEELEEQITTLKEQLVEHGGHKEDCPAHPDYGGGAYGRKCDCGWAEIAKGLA